MARQNGNQQFIDTAFLYGGNAAYAWKNLEYWWKNTHTNPDSNTTAWTAKMKPVWFTEFGFPSVDGCTNQPNVFYDPSSSESFFPRASRGRVDFQAQRVALDATLDYLEERRLESGNANLVQRRFIWTWDARPFSFWPDLENVWQDSIQWATGHWVNGKLGASTLGAVVAGGVLDHRTALHLMRTGAAGVLVGFGGGTTYTTSQVLGIAVPMAKPIRQLTM